MAQLRIPGPTPLPDEVIKAMAQPMINHRSAAFAEILNGVTEKMKKVFQTRNDVLLLTGSGTGGMEAAIVNVVSPGDKVLSLAGGEFADRFANIARRFGADVVLLACELGKAADPQAVRQALKQNPGIKAVLVTHNETSTGVTNPLEEISRVVKEYDKLLIVDAISSLSSINLPVDAWHCDIVISGSQKGWMAPPGMTMLSVSEAAWQVQARATAPRFYWDFTQAKNYLTKGQTPWTPSVTTIYALAASLDMMLKEGLANIFARHALVGKTAREGAKSLGLGLFADEKYASDTVTAIAASGGLDTKVMLKMMRQEHGIELAGGQGKLDGKIFRIGHMGWVTVKEIKEVIAALKVVLPKAGFRNT
ncbi:MAG: alanine--glyoxylate aminotransferase family protein [Chloroflexota bacterium]